MDVVGDVATTVMFALLMVTVAMARMLCAIVFTVLSAVSCAGGLSPRRRGRASVARGGWIGDMALPSRAMGKTCVRKMAKPRPSPG